MNTADDFSGLLPDDIIAAAETALGKPMSGFSRPCASYINRVYELEAADRTRYIIKFYRPGRWSRAAIAEEHALMAAAVADEIPIIAPLPLSDGATLGTTPEQISFALYPKSWGRPMEILDLEGWKRLGRLLGRLHVAGETVDFTARWRFTPDSVTLPALERLTEADIMPLSCQREFIPVAQALLERLEERFDGAELIVAHGDCHAGNILDRPDTGLVLIDFDDCMLAPAVQDWWLLLPDHAAACREELHALAEGYEEFRFFDYGELKLIEALRAMRMIYYLDWCRMQKDDYLFRRNHPEWGSENFWRRETADLASQLELL